MWNLITSLPRRWSFLFSCCDLIHVTWYYSSKSRCFRTWFLWQNIWCKLPVAIHDLFSLRKPAIFGLLWRGRCSVSSSIFFVMFSVVAPSATLESPVTGNQERTQGMGKWKITTKDFPVPLSPVPYPPYPLLVATNFKIFYDCSSFLSWEAWSVKKKNSHVRPFLSWTTCINLLVKNFQINPVICSL